MTSVTSQMIRDAFRGGPETKRKLSGIVAANIAECADTPEQWAFSDTGVYLLHPSGQIILCFGWDLFGQFRLVGPQLDVTKLVDRSELTLVEPAVAAGGATSTSN